jgi:homoserine dehydrogenase
MQSSCSHKFWYYAVEKKSSALCARGHTDKRYLNFVADKNSHKTHNAFPPARVKSQKVAEVLLASLKRKHAIISALKRQLTAHQRQLETRPFQFLIGSQ